MLLHIYCIYIYTSISPHYYWPGGVCPVVGEELFLYRARTYSFNRNISIRTSPYHSCQCVYHERFQTILLKYVDVGTRYTSLDIRNLRSTMYRAQSSIECQSGAPSILVPSCTMPQPILLNIPTCIDRVYYLACKLSLNINNMQVDNMIERPRTE